MSFKEIFSSAKKFLISLAFIGEGEENIKEAISRIRNFLEDNKWENAKN